MNELHPYTACKRQLRLFACTLQYTVTRTLLTIAITGACL